jgi:hypothetical protein
MERIQSLITKLQQQYDQQAGAAQMQITLQLLQAELNHLKSNGARTLGTSKVAVTLPSMRNGSYAEERTKVEEVAVKEAPVKETQFHHQFDPLFEIPTLSHQQGVKEINETVEHQESLNDKLKEEKIELLHVLKESPIRDLRKAIGINDRYLFISDLFRGDESMYERSIKTINSFNVYTEAEYWMNRELKVKLGWDDNKETVTHLYQLVRRRFA